jgi:SAM-dependent methyltransferase
LEQAANFDTLDANKLAATIRDHAAAVSLEEPLKIRVEATLRPILEKWGIKWASYEHRLEITGGKEDALYGRVIIEYKAPGKLDSKVEFEKAKKQVKDYITEQAKGDCSRYYGIVLDGNKIAFLRYRKDNWDEQQEPLPVNGPTVLQMLKALRGLRRKPLDAEYLLADFGPKSILSRIAVSTLYNSLAGQNSSRTRMLFSDWKRVFSQVCSYSPEKLTGLAEYYEMKAKGIDFEKLLFAIHTYYTILMKLLTSEIVTLFTDSLLGSYLKRLEEGYYRKDDQMLDELKHLEEGGIFAAVGIRNFLEADYFASYLDEWNSKIAESIFQITQRLLGYEPATVELNPEMVRDLFKRLYQNLVPRDIRHRLGEYFTPDWLAQAVLDEAGYVGNPEKRILDPSCGSGTFLVLAIKRIREYAEENFIDQRPLIKTIIQNVCGIDLNPLAVLAAKANYIIALADLLRYRPSEGIEIPIYLADSISVVSSTTKSGQPEFELKTNEGRFWITKEVIDKNYLYPILNLIADGVKVKWSREQFEKYLSKDSPLSSESVKSFVRLYAKIHFLENHHKNRIWTSLLKNAFSPLLIGKFDYVVGNPPWVNWENLPEYYRESTKQLWDQYGLLEKLKGSGMGKVRRDIATLFVARCADLYLRTDATLSFLIPFNVLKTQGAGGFRKYLSTMKIIGVHELSELYPFEGATNRTGLIAIKSGHSDFPIPCTMWTNPKSSPIDMMEELSNVYKITKQDKIMLAPILQGKPESPWMMLSQQSHKIVMRIVGESAYTANVGSYTGLNGVYWIDILAKEPNGLLIKNSNPPGLKKKVKQVTAVIEPDLIYPLARGRDVAKWFVKPSSNIVLPHSHSGQPIIEDEMKSTFLKSYRYLLEFHKGLASRAIHKLWGKGRPFYTVYDVGSYTFSPFKVVYKDISGKISAKGEFGGAAVMSSAFTEYLENRTVIPDTTLMFVACKSLDEAHYLASVLNSLIVRLIASAYSIVHVRGHIMKYIGIKEFDPTDSLHLKLVQLSKQAHELAKNWHEQNDSKARKELDKLEAENDVLVSQLYAISQAEMTELTRTLKILKPSESD